MFSRLDQKRKIEEAKSLTVQQASSKLVILILCS